MVQQRNTQGELEAQRAQLRDLTQARKQVQVEVEELREQLEVSRSEAASL
jgi:myosin protein heavy chain